MTTTLILHRYKRLTRVRIRLCSAHCKHCVGAHEFTPPMDAERIDYSHVRITQLGEPVWFGAVVCSKDYEICGEDE